MNEQATFCESQVYTGQEIPDRMRVCFLLWQYNQRFDTWAEIKLQQQKLYLYVFQNYVLVT